MQFMKNSLRLLLVAFVLGRLLTPLAAQGAIAPQAVTSQAGVSQAAAEAAGATIKLRIGVVADNLYRVLPANLQAAGVDPATVDPRSFALSSLGQPVAIRVVDNGNGRFDAGEYFEFFGQRFRGMVMEEKYTDERVYWLDTGGTAGPRIADVDARPPNGYTPPVDFPTTVHAEQNTVYWALWSQSFDTEDTWFWQLLGTNGTGNFPYTVPDPAPGYDGTLRLEEVARQTYTHRTTLNIGGTQLLDASWSGNIRKVFTVTVPSGLLNSPTMTVTVGAPSPSENTLVNYWELDYRRLFRAFNNQLDFRAEKAGAQDFSIAAFTATPVAVWDITNALQPRRLTNASTTGSGPYTVRFHVTPAAGDRFWLQTEGTFASPASVILRTNTGLRNPSDPNNTGAGADTVIVIPDARVVNLRSAAENLAAWHRAHHRRTIIADLQDVYDEYNYGIRHPQAIRNMMTYAATNWAQPGPVYLTLMGDGHYNMKGYNPDVYGTAINPIPPYLGIYDPWQGEVASDGILGDIDGDDMPDIAVGRLNVRTLAEANTVVGKIQAYDETLRDATWQQRATFVSDRNDPSVGNFPALTDELVAGYLPPELTPQKIYLGSAEYPDATTTRNAIRSAINAGTFTLHYTGHSSPTIWASHETGGIWTTSDVSSLTNSSLLTVVMTADCLDGYYILPDEPRQAMAEVLLRQSGGGMVAGIMAAGMGLAPDEQLFDEIQMDTLYKSGVRDLGRALQVTKQQFITLYGKIYLLYTMSLFGDPALQIPVGCTTPAAVGDVSVTSSGADVTLSWPVALNASGYRVWRGTQPYFTVDPNATPAYATTNATMFDGTRYTDASAGGNPAQNRYYVVASTNACANQASAVSQRVAAFSFSLIR